MKIKKFGDVKTPTYNYLGDAGLDLYSPETIIIKPHSKSERISLKIGFGVPYGYCGIVSERSSQGKIGIHTIGNIVDSGYTGEVHVTLVNDSDEEYIVNKDEKICQIYFPMVLIPTVEIVDELEASERGDKSHGSTGKT